MNPPAPSLTELVGPPEDGRKFTEVRRPLLADCAPSGRVRLDALTRMLQDVAFADVDDAGVSHLAVWVVRRSRIVVERFPRFGERLTLTTFCSGLGRMWAERRTTIAGAGEARGCVEAVSLWVHLDPVSWRPMPFTAEEVSLYGDAAASRKVSARLHHPAPAAIQERSTWQFRAIDCDVADHVNNAAYWQPLEEELLGGADPERIDVEMEFRTPAQPGEMAVLREGPRRWITSAEGETHASIVIASLH